MANPSEFLKEFAELMKRHDVLGFGVDNSECSEGSWDYAKMDVSFTDGTDVILNELDTYFTVSHVEKASRKFVTE